MEGSVRYADGGVLVPTQFIDGATDAHLWWESYEREPATFSRFRATIALSVHQALQVRVVASGGAVARARADEVALPAPTSIFRPNGSARHRDWSNRRTTARAHRTWTHPNRPRPASRPGLDASVSGTSYPFVDPPGGQPRFSPSWRAGRAARAVELTPQPSVRRTPHLGLFPASSSRLDRRREQLLGQALGLDEPLGDIGSHATLQQCGRKLRATRARSCGRARALDPRNPTASQFSNDGERVARRLVHSNVAVRARSRLSTHELGRAATDDALASGTGRDR